MQKKLIGTLLMIVAVLLLGIEIGYVFSGFCLNNQNSAYALAAYTIYDTLKEHPGNYTVYTAGDGRLQVVYDPNATTPEYPVNETMTINVVTIAAPPTKPVLHEIEYPLGDTRFDLRLITWENVSVFEQALWGQWWI